MERFQISQKASRITLYTCLMAFTVFIAFIFHLNEEVLYTAQDRSEFLIGAPMFNALMSKPFGLIQYAGAWLTQFLFKPWVGAGILLAIWALIFLSGVKAFRLKGSDTALMLLPIAFLLTSLVDMGYWIYVLPIRGYWFSQSLGYLVMLTLLWIARSTPRKWHLCWYLVGFCLYPLLGWFSLLLILCLIFTEDTISWREFIGFIILLMTGHLWQALLYSNLKADYVVMAGFPKFVTPSDMTEHLSLPFWLLGAVSVFIVVFAKYLKKWFVPVLCALTAIIFTWTQMYRDENYLNEMRMSRYAEANNWKEVLDVFEDASDPTVSMVMLKNIALMYEGGLLDSSFKMGNEISNTYNPDSIHVSFLETASSLAYYNYGLMNEGFRLTFECAEQAGFSPFYLKMLTRCAHANGETELVNRFVSLLHAHPYYRDWQPEPINEKTSILKNSYPDELTGVENSVKYLIYSISQWYESDNKLTSEQSLFYSMLRCDSRRFWASIRKYAKLHPDEEFPLHVQEAYIIYMDKAPEERRIMIPIRQDIYERYKAFWSSIEELAGKGVKPQDIPEKMRKDYGDTYWYYNIFGRKI